MAGTSLPATSPIRRIPPRMTKPTSDCHDGARQPGRDGEAVRGERDGHGVDLDGVADAEGGDCAEDGEGEAEPLAELGRELADAVSQVVHRAADVLARLVLLAVGDRADRFGVLRRHAEERDQPHVEDCARAAERNRGRDSGDVPGAHGGRERRHERVEGLDLALAGGAALVEEQAKAVAHLAPGHEHEAEGEQHAGHAQDAEHRRSPGEGVDRVNHRVQSFHWSLLRDESKTWAGASRDGGRRRFRRPCSPRFTVRLRPAAVLLGLSHSSWNLSQNAEEERKDTRIA